MRKQTTALYEGSSTSNQMHFKFYDSGCLALFETNGKFPPTKNGPGGFLRINNLRQENRKTILRLVERIDELGVPDYANVIDYGAALRSDFLPSYLACKEQDPWLSFATFQSACRDANGTYSYRALLDRVRERGPELLLRARELNRTAFMLRRELGVISEDIKVSSYRRELEQLSILISERLQHEIYSFIYERFLAGVEDHKLLRWKSRKFSSLDGNDFRYSGYLYQHMTPEESFGFRELMEKAGGESNYPLNFGGEINALIGYTHMRYGDQRTHELVQFLLNTYRVSYVYGERDYTLIFHDSEITLEKLKKALKEDIPLELALMLCEE